MSPIQESIARVEAAWRSVGHPLAEAAKVGADPSVLREEFADWTGGLTVPEELLALWSWWDGRFPPGQGSRVWSVALPGPLNLLSFSYAQELTEMMPDELLSDRTRRWVCVMSDESMLGAWAELDAVAADGSTPVSITYHDEPLDDGVIARFSSVAELLSAMAFLIESGRWSSTLARGWSLKQEQPSDWVALMGGSA